MGVEYTDVDENRSFNAGNNIGNENDALSASGDKKALNNGEVNENDDFDTKQSMGMISISPVAAGVEPLVTTPTSNRRPFQDLSNHTSNTNTPKSITSKASTISPIAPNNPNASVNADFHHHVNLSYKYIVSLEDDDDDGVAADKDDESMTGKGQHGGEGLGIAIAHGCRAVGHSPPSAASEMDYSGYAGSISAAASDCWSHDSMDVDVNVNVDMGVEDVDDDIEFESDESDQSNGPREAGSRSRANPSSMNRVKKNIKFQFLTGEHVNGISMNSVGGVRTGPGARLGVGSRPRLLRSQDDSHTDDNSRVTTISTQMKRSRERRRKLRMESEQATKANLLSEFRAFMGWTTTDPNSARKKKENKESSFVIGIRRPESIDVVGGIEILENTTKKQHTTPNNSRGRRGDAFEDNIPSPFSPHQIHGRIPFIVVPDSEDEISTIQGSNYNDSPQKDCDDYMSAWKNYGEFCDEEAGSITRSKTKRKGENGDFDHRKKEWIYLSLIAASIVTLTALVVIFIVHF